MVYGLEFAVGLRGGVGPVMKAGLAAQKGGKLLLGRSAQRFCGGGSGAGDEVAAILDPADRLAGWLARQGDPEPLSIEETDTSFALGWKGSYRIEGQAFVYLDRDAGRIITILGYPTDRLAQLS